MNPVIRMNRRQCLYALISAAVVVVCVCVGVTMNLTTIYDENFDHMGIRTFCMFTVNSNILAAVSMFLCLPYTIDGLRTNNYHLPKWVVMLVFTGVTAVSLTFLVSLIILSPVKGFVLIFSGSRLFLHGICPVMAVVAFRYFISDYRIGLGESLISVIPVMIYAIIYTVMVLVIGQEKGGWEDFYGFFTRLPPWVPMVLILPLTFVISIWVRTLHNRAYDLRQQREAAYYSGVFAGTDARETVEVMARSNAGSLHISNVVVPLRLIRIILENSDSNVTVEELCDIYLRSYLEEAASATK